MGVAKESRDTPTAVNHILDRSVHRSSHESKEAEDDESGEDAGRTVGQRYDQRISGRKPKTNTYRQLQNFQQEAHQLVGSRQNTTSLNLKISADLLRVISGDLTSKRSRNIQLFGSWASFTRFCAVFNCILQLPGSSCAAVKFRDPRLNCSREIRAMPSDTAFSQAYFGTAADRK